MNRRTQTLIVFALLLGIAVAGRVLSKEMSLWNFTPVAAVGMFAGFFFERKTWAALMCVAAMAISNLIIGDGYLHIGVMLTVYAALLFPILLRGILRDNLSAPRVLGCAIVSSVVFAVTTNFAHWWCTMPHTLGDLGQAYVQALPFFRMTLAGDLCFAVLLFGGYAWGLLGSRELAPARSSR